MSEENNGLTKGFLIGLLAGGVIGAITALLYAPKSGKELRSEIKKKANDLAENASDYMKTAQKKTLEMINKGKRHSEGLASGAKEKAEIILDDAERVLTEIRGRANTESSKVKSAFRAGVDAYKTEKEKGHRTS